MKYEKAWLTLGASVVAAALIWAVIFVYVNHPPYRIDERHGRYFRLNVWTGEVQYTHQEQDHWE